MAIATGTLSVISWAEQEHTLTIARTMGVVTFSLLNLFFSIEAKDERQSAFSLDTFSDRTFIVAAEIRKAGRRRTAAEVTTADQAVPPPAATAT